MKRLLPLVILLMALSVACGSAAASSITQPSPPREGASPGTRTSSQPSPVAYASDFTPAPVPELQDTASEQQPFYFYLFTHTEDPFNLDLSEERFTRFVPAVEERAASHPDSGLVWTIEFQGTDAYAIAQRNPETGVLDLLRDASAQGIVEFGYHAHHEATYNNRPQNSFTETTSWEDLTNGMLEWVQCLREATTGNCLAPTGGGIEFVDEQYGPVQIVTGDFMVADMAYEGGPTTHAVQAILPDRVLSFGYPDHGPFASGARRDAVAALMERLTPTNDTSSTVFWADNVIKMTGGSPIDGTRGIDPLRGPKYAQSMLAGLDRSRPNVVLTGLASKFLYTKQGLNNSPTIYGYAHPDDPQLPPELLNTPEQKEQFYQNSLQTLDYLLDEVLPANPGSVFLNSQEVVNMVAPPDYWTVSPAQLDVLARWALLNWTDRPPDWVSDGTDFYSLRDLFALLTLAFGEHANSGAGPDLRLPTAYGPLAAVDADTAVFLSRDEIVALAASLAPDFAPDQPWQVTPNAMVQPTYATSAGTITAAQLLYGMATVYASDFAGTPVSAVRLPATQAMPVTYDLLKEIGCLNTCSGTAWSFKPAPLRTPSSPSEPTPTPTPTPTLTSTPTLTPTPAPEHGQPTIYLPALLAQDSTPPAPSSTYTLFSINVQDFSYPAKSAEVLEKIITLHEETHVPVDIYLTDTMAQIFAEHYPDLLQRLKTSPVVAVSYHTRPPRPYASQNDWLGLAAMSQSQLHATIQRYETHAVDAVSGRTTSAAGGYQHVAELIGYPPYAASAFPGNPQISATAVQVFRELGARMTVAHGKSVALGDMRDGLPLRPEQVDYRLFEHVGEDAGTAFAAALAQAQGSGESPAFVGVKMHDNDFFATQSAWVTVYVQDRRRPPWNPDLKAPLLSPAEQDAMWALYEATVRYVAAHPQKVTPVNLPMVLAMLE